MPTNRPTESAPGDPAFAGRGRSLALVFACTVFTSAFLLFQVQPLIARFILPWFGASPGVWATCLLFFQVLLLVGYAYAHVLVRYLSLSRQAGLHMVLLAVAALTLPITPDAALQPVDGTAPTWRILVVLATSVALPYLVLAATGPLLQGWLVALRPERSPYRYYALSNVGSLLALLSYPFVFERMFTRTQQTEGWSWAYLGFALLCGACALRLRRFTRGVPASTGPSQGEVPGWRVRLLWLGLSATASALLLATTNQLCLDVAAVPFLWIVPLALYLLSFILCFDSDRWYVRPLVLGLLALCLCWTVQALSLGSDLDLSRQILVFCGTLFVACMACHGELARLRPAPMHLTAFYLVLALGGALGGFFVAIVAPQVFTGFYEYPLLLVLVGLVVGLAVLSRPAGEAPRWRLGLGLVGVGALLACVAYGAIVFFDASGWLLLTDREGEYERYAPLALRVRVGMFVAPLLLWVLLDVARWRRGASVRAWWGPPAAWVRGVGAAVGASGLVLLSGALGWLALDDERYDLQARTFYGVLRIRESLSYAGLEKRSLYNGHINHGLQLAAHPEWAVSYYGPDSGLGWAIRRHPQRTTPGRAFHIGVVGLGTGTVAAYANAALRLPADGPDYVAPRRRRPPDRISFYEINPLVVRWAEEHFRFLADARRRGAETRVYEGDARLVLERQARAGAVQGFDVLAIDAFTSDAIPIHLLTRESVELYVRHLKPDGILALHVSNLHLDLVPVVRRLGEVVGKGVVYIENQDDPAHGVDGSDWVLLTNNLRFLRDPELLEVRRELPPAGPLWTDDFSSLFEVLQAEDDE